MDPTVDWDAMRCAYARLAAHGGSRNHNVKSSRVLQRRRDEEDPLTERASDRTRDLDTVRCTCLELGGSSSDDGQDSSGRSDLLYVIAAVNSSSSAKDAQPSVERASS